MRSLVIHGGGPIEKKEKAIGRIFYQENGDHKEKNIQVSYAFRKATQKSKPSGCVALRPPPVLSTLRSNKNHRLSKLHQNISLHNNKKKKKEKKKPEAEKSHQNLAPQVVRSRGRGSTYL